MIDLVLKQRIILAHIDGMSIATNDKVLKYITAMYVRQLESEPLLE